MFASLSSARTCLEQLAATLQPATLTGEQALQLVNELGAIRRLTDALLTVGAKRVADTAAYTAGGDRDAAQFVARAVGVEASEARRTIAVAQQLESLPETEAALREGRISARQAQLVAETARHAPAAEAGLIAAAAEGMVPLKDACVRARAAAEDAAARARRQHGARSLRIWTAVDGMVEGHFRLAPEVGSRIKSRIDAETQRIFRARRVSGPHESLAAYAADALADAFLPDDGKATVTSLSVHVVVDHAVLVRGAAVEGERCEIPGVGPVNIDWVREQLGSAFVTAVVKKGRDITTVAHFGRHIPAVLQTAMIVGGRECDVVGCHSRGYLERDHSEIDYARGGPTAWWNLTWLCAVHHRRKTAGWRLGPRDRHTGRRTLTPPESSRGAAEPRPVVSRR